MDKNKGFFSHVITAILEVVIIIIGAKIAQYFFGSFIDRCSSTGLSPWLVNFCDKYHLNNQLIAQSIPYLAIYAFAGPISGIICFIFGIGSVSRSMRNSTIGSHRYYNSMKSDNPRVWSTWEYDPETGFDKRVEHTSNDGPESMQFILWLLMLFIVAPNVGYLIPLFVIGNLIAAPFALLRSIAGFLLGN